MTDYFALFGEPRRPWIEVDSLKDRFLQLSSALHPDRNQSPSTAARLEANDTSAEINAAFNCLRDDRDRILHLLVLEKGSKPPEIDRIPGDLMDLFMRVAEALRGADDFLREKSKINSPLLKVQWFERGMDLVGKLQSLRQLIEGRRQIFIDEIKLMNSSWLSAPATGSPSRLSALPLARLEEVYRQLSYYHRWLEQIRERVTQLSF